MNPLWTLLEGAAADRGDEPFLTDLRSGETLSYAALVARAGSAAAWLADRGVAPGDRVGYVTKNDPAFFPLLLGCARRGATLVPVNVDGTPEETADVLEDAEARVVLCDGAAPEHGDGWIPVGEELFGTAGEVPVEACPPETNAIFIYTSGTTGRSKGVMLSHRNLTAMSATLASVYGYRPGQRFLGMLPNYHINAPVVTGLSCLTGRTHVFVTDPYGFTNARLIFPFVEEYGIQVISLTPSIMASLLKFNPDGAPSDISSVELGLVGTAHLPEPLWRKFEETYGFPCYQGYGLTETTTWATMTPPDERKRYDSAGVPIGCEVAIDDEAGGEILIRGDVVMNGYHKRKKLTKQSFTEDWFRTGDIGRLDDDGQLLITGRIKNIIKRRGILVSPEGIDDVLRRFPETTDACTIGVPDELSGERIVSACLVPAEKVEALGAFTRKHLSAHSYPDEILAVGALPKTKMGKPDLAELRRIVTGEKVDAVIKSFDAYRFRRSRTPDMPAIRARLQRAFLEAQPVEIVGFWGVGSRPASAEPDVVALDRLALFLEAINTAADRELATMSLVLADIHARCNQVPAEVHGPYFEAIGALAEERGFRTMWLSEVWDEHSLEFETVLRQMDTSEALEEWESFPLREDFLLQASRRCGGDEALVEEYAYRYFLTIRMENPAMAQSFADSVFFTYNGTDFRVALPELPMVHLHSIKPGTAAKPWFLE